MRLTTLTGLCVLIILAGCQFRGAGQIPEINVHTGTKGITAKFLEQSPPTLVYADSPFSASIDLANEGAWDVDDGYLSIGVEDDFVILQGEKLRGFTLAGRSLALPEGEREIQTVQLQARALPPKTETVTTTIAMNICYPYKTDAEATVCVDTDVFQRAKTKACTAKTVSLSGQGAPVVVTRIAPTYAPAADATKVQAQFVIGVKNAGGGQLYVADKSLEACTPAALGDPSQRRDLWNVATVRVFLGDQELDCRPKQQGASGREGYLQLVGNEDSVTCDVPGGIPKTAGTYTTTMTVEVEYGYTFTITKQVQIKRLG